MTRADRVEAFRRWFTAQPDRDVAWSASLVEGILAVAGSADAVTADHVATAARFARESKVGDVAALERLGALLVRYEQERDAPPAARPAPVVAEAQAPVADVVVSFRASTSLPALDAPAPSSEPASEPAPDVAAESEGATQTAAPTRARRPVARTVAVTLIGLAAVGGVIAFVARGDERVAPATTTNVPRARLRGVNLVASLPSGWKEEPGAGTSTVYRGSTGADADLHAYLSSVPRTGALAASTDADKALLVASRAAERAIESQLVRDDVRYVPEACSVISVEGVRLGTCRGRAHAGAESRQVATFVRVVADREVVATMLARAAGDASPDVARIVASLAP